MLILNEIAQAIYDKKGFNILVLDVHEICSITDFFVIAEGSADRHVQAIAKMLIEFLEKKGYPLHREEGVKTGDWVVLDFHNFIIHLFMPELRERYSLEQVWQKGQIVNVTINVQTGT